MLKLIQGMRHKRKTKSDQNDHSSSLLKQDNDKASTPQAFQPDLRSHRTSSQPHTSPAPEPAAAPSDQTGGTANTNNAFYASTGGVPFAQTTSDYPTLTSAGRHTTAFPDASGGALSLSDTQGTWAKTMGTKSALSSMLSSALPSAAVGLEFTEDTQQKSVRQDMSGWVRGETVTRTAKSQVTVPPSAADASSSSQEKQPGTMPDGSVGGSTGCPMQQKTLCQELSGCRQGGSADTSTPPQTVHPSSVGELLATVGMQPGMVARGLPGATTDRPKQEGTGCQEEVVEAVTLRMAPAPTTVHLRALEGATATQQDAALASQHQATQPTAGADHALEGNVGWPMKQETVKKEAKGRGVHALVTCVGALCMHACSLPFSMNEAWMCATTEMAKVGDDHSSAHLRC
jgi:hypothetical protein